MRYVMSDLHGRYDLYQRMLGELDFSDEDTLYLLGDLADRGPDGIPLMQDVMRRPNVFCLRGNHEDMFLRVIRNSAKPRFLPGRFARKSVFRNWTLANGGAVTWEAYLALPEPERAEIRAFLEGLPLYWELEAGGNSFLLCHAGVGRYAPDKDPAACSVHELIWVRMDYDRVYYPDKYLVSGHTPTALIDTAYLGRILRKNRHIAMDCGAVFLGKLGCLCLETLEEICVSV